MGFLKYRDVLYLTFQPQIYHSYTLKYVTIFLACKICPPSPSSEI